MTDDVELGGDEEPEQGPEPEDPYRYLGAQSSRMHAYHDALDERLHAALRIVGPTDDGTEPAGRGRGRGRGPRRRRRGRVVTTRVIGPVDLPEPRLPPARRKGPAGAWQLLVDGHWIAERAVQAHEAVERLGDKKAAAEALGLTNDQVRSALAVWETAQERMTRPPAAKPPARPGRVEVHPTVSQRSDDEQTDSEPVDASRNGHVRGFMTPPPLPHLTSLPEIPELPGELLEMSAGSYDQGFAVGFMAGVLTVLAEEGVASGSGLRGAARKALQLLEAAP